MPNIIRIRNLQPETDINDIIIPVDKARPEYDQVRRVSANDLKEWILSGFTGGGGSTTSGTSGTSGIQGIDGTSGTSPCLVLDSNVITIQIVYDCVLEGVIDCYDCLLEAEIECDV